jgi:hypothetical protein
MQKHKADRAAASADGQTTGPQDDFRLDVGLWLGYAAADAAQEGTEVPESCQ